MTQIEKGFEVIHVLKKFNGRVTRNTLVSQLNMSDRAIRKIIEDINKDCSDEFKKYLIVSTSDEPGYKLADNLMDVIIYDRDTLSRIAALNMKLPKINYFKEVYASERCN